MLVMRSCTLFRHPLLKASVSACQNTGLMGLFAHSAQTRSKAATHALMMGQNASHARTPTAVQTKMDHHATARNTFTRTQIKSANYATRSNPAYVATKPTLLTNVSNATQTNTGTPPHPTASANA